MKTSNTRRMLLFGLIIALGVGLDQLTKWIVATTMELYEAIPLIPGFIELRYIVNRGAAWGMFSNHRWIFLAITGLAIIVLPVILWHYRKLPLLFGISLSMIISGGIGNMIDRLAFGEVTDFIATVFIDFPVFNIADCFVTVGAGLMFIYLIFFDKEFFRNNKKEASEKPAQNGDIHENHSDSE